jgi:hypothetical protein
MKKTVLIAAALMFSMAFAATGEACFDTFLFLHKKSMVYPKGYMAMDVMGEYSVNDANKAENDSYFTNYSMFYGLAERLSVQGGVSTTDTSRTENKYEADSWTARGVLNTVNNAGNFYFMDFIVEHHSGIAEEGQTTEFSIPNLFYVKHFTFVVHPVMEMSWTGKNQYAPRGHGGVFYNIGNIGIFGLGTEYGSPQSSSMLGKQLSDGEWAASIFVGANLGNVYVQSELAKGLMNSRDLGFAMTVKGFLDLRGI